MSKESQTCKHESNNITWQITYWSFENNAEYRATDCYELPEKCNRGGNI